MIYLYETCPDLEINRVEVIIHWIQVLITNNPVLDAPPPILSRAYQTLSRGMVHLNNARKLADVPFPFPLSQMQVVMLLIQCVSTPIVMGSFHEHYATCVICTILPLTGMWGLTFVAE